jgi:hypothetical protein
MYTRLTSEGRVVLLVMFKVVAWSGAIVLGTGGVVVVGSAIHDGFERLVNAPLPVISPPWATHNPNTFVSASAKNPPATNWISVGGPEPLRNTSSAPRPYAAYSLMQNDINNFERRLEIQNHIPPAGYNTVNLRHLVPDYIDHEISAGIESSPGVQPVSSTQRPSSNR